MPASTSAHLLLVHGLASARPRFISGTHHQIPTQTNLKLMFDNSKTPMTTSRDIYTSSSRRNLARLAAHHAFPYYAVSFLSASFFVILISITHQVWFATRAIETPDTTDMRRAHPHGRLSANHVFFATATATSGESNLRCIDHLDAQRPTACPYSGQTAP